MPRRQQIDSGPRNDRWVISYADFITLLFAFFVVMYAISSVNEEKYKHLTEALSGVFVGVDQGKKRTKPLRMEVVIVGLGCLRVEKQRLMPLK